jgi:hypothetical protein
LLWSKDCNLVFASHIMIMLQLSAYYKNIYNIYFLASSYALINLNYLSLKGNVIKKIIVYKSNGNHAKLCFMNWFSFSH